MAFDSVKKLLSDNEEEYVRSIPVGPGISGSLFADGDDDMVAEFATDLDLAAFLFVRDRIEDHIKDNAACVELTDIARVAARALCCLLRSIRSGSTCLRLSSDQFGILTNWFPVLDDLNNISNINGAPVLIYNHDGSSYLCFNKHIRAALSLQMKLSSLDDGLTDLCFEEKKQIVASGVFNNDQHYNDQQQIAINNMPFSGVYIVTGGPGTGKTTVAAALLRVFFDFGCSVSDVFLCAPTGRAADHLAASVKKYLKEYLSGADGLKSGTIHSLIGTGAGKPKYGPENRLPYRVIIADEFSMADLKLAGAFFDAVPEETLLILLGDPDQLPSVEAGAVLNELIKVLGPKHRVAELTENMRSQENIKRLMGALKNSSRDSKPEDFFIDGQVSSAKSDGGIKGLFDEWKTFIGAPAKEGCVKVYYTGEGNDRPNEYALSKDIADKWFGMFSDGYSGKIRKAKEALEPIILFREDGKEASGASEEQMTSANRELGILFDHLDSYKVLCCLREGAFGCVNMNDMLEAALKKNLGREHGVPVIITRNDREKGLFNGNTGVILTLETGGDRRRVAVFRKGSAQGSVGMTVGGFAVYPLTALPEYDRAFAVTVHKSQGSEYGHVLTLVPFAGENSNVKRMLTHEILYTAVTRAKQSVCIICHKESLTRAAKTSALEDRTSIPINASK